MSKFKVGDIIKPELVDYYKVTGYERSSKSYLVEHVDRPEIVGKLHKDSVVKVSSSEASESSTKPSDTITPPITFTNGTDFLEGEFEANSEVYEVSVRKKEKGRTE